MNDWRVNSCDRWHGYCDRGGYGQAVAPVYGTRKVHRIEWIKHFGPPPDDRPHVLHHCDSPPCHEITHLFVGSEADNMADKKAKGRHHNQIKVHCPRCGNEYTTNTEGKRRCMACERKRKNARRQAARRIKMSEEGIKYIRLQVEGCTIVEFVNGTRACSCGHERGETPSLRKP